MDISKKVVTRYTARISPSELQEIVYNAIQNESDSNPNDGIDVEETGMPYREITVEWTEETEE